MNKTALIFGAGKTGRGFAAHLAFLGGYEIILVDKNRELISALGKTKQYDIRVLGNEEMSCAINISGAYPVEDASWHDAFVRTHLVFTAVFGNNLEALAGELAVAFQKRYAVNPEQPLTMITCENLTNAAGILKQSVTRLLGGEKEKWISEHVGFSEAMIFRTCLGAGPGQLPLTIRAQNYFELPCDADAIKEELGVYGLKPLKDFGNQLRRKIYTYNCINAVITYLGAQKGYTQLYEAANDREILEIAKEAARESSLAQIAEFGFDHKEQEAWTRAAFAKFADENVPDPIERNGADPIRKLGRNDRLIGPALLALQHHIHPGALLKGILACFEYRDADKNIKISDLIREKGAESVLKEVCGLSDREKLFMLIHDQIIKSHLNGNE